VTRNAKTVRVATDVGGTFTDLVYFEIDPVSGKQTIRTKTLAFLHTARRSSSMR
jgi:N-methylhydantoinase A/oxoprolinase/acetone carboxylase beta subunit